MNNRSRLSGIITFIVTTFGEFIAVYYWLLFFNEGHITWAIAVLLIGFIIERGAVVLHFHLPFWITDQKGNKSSILLILVFVTVSEILTWVMMLQMSVHLSYIYSAIIFAILIHLIHSYEAKVILVGTMKASLLNPGTITLSLVETFGAVGLVYFTAHQKPMTGAGVLLGSLLVEHTLQVVGLTAERKGHDVKK
jgi:hypothetical protein